MRTAITRFLSIKIEKSQQKAFFRAIDEGNLQRISLLSTIGFGFLFLLLVLDFFRWQRGGLEGIYFQIFLAHLGMGLFGVVAFYARRMLRKWDAGLEIPQLSRFVFAFPIIVGVV